MLKEVRSLRQLCRTLGVILSECSPDSHKQQLDRPWSLPAVVHSQERIPPGTTWCQGLRDLSPRAAAKLPTGESSQTQLCCVCTQQPLGLCLLPAFQV